MRLNFQNRIAFHYMIATALIMAAVFGTVYWVVYSTVYKNLDGDILFEAKKHSASIQMEGDSIWFRNKAELEEREHREIQFNPVFVQIINLKGNTMDRSSNLKSDYLTYKKGDYTGFFDTQLGGISIRQVQLPIQVNGETKGYILTAMTSESAQFILRDLRNALIGCYLFALGGLYFVSRFLAGRSILPIQKMNTTINTITRYNLLERVDLPPNRDELYELATSFNKLLDRIAAALERERQFTSDASHQLRTPLASLRGTLEVLIRKQRSPEEYKEKIEYSLSEIDRMSNTVEQLLLLARLDADPALTAKRKIELVSQVEDCLGRLKIQIKEKQLQVQLDIKDAESMVPKYYSELILDNILQNAVKYSRTGGQLHIRLDSNVGRPFCKIKDSGIGIQAEDLQLVFNNFYRGQATQYNGIKGTGLGLSIAKKAADAIQADIQVESHPGEGSTFTVVF